MVDVGLKPVTVRKAVARGEVHMQRTTWQALVSGNLPKGDAVCVARLAGIQAAKRTAELIPLCHPLPLDGIDIDCDLSKPGRVVITAAASVAGRTGVEMESLTAVSVAALAVYDMCKALDRGITIGPIGLVEKMGGRSGHWKRPS